MSNKPRNSDSPVSALKSEAARQRWELFHRAIAHAKESNNSALADGGSTGNESVDPGPLLTVVK